MLVDFGVITSQLYLGLPQKADILVYGDERNTNIKITL